jgi:Ras family
MQTVSFEEGETLAREYNIHFFETSAKQDMNVEKSFITIATDVKDRLMVDGGSGGACSGTAASHHLGTILSSHNYSSSPEHSYTAAVLPDQ